MCQVVFSVWSVFAFPKPYVLTETKYFHEVSWLLSSYLIFLFLRYWNTTVTLFYLLQSAKIRVLVCLWSSVTYATNNNYFRKWHGQMLVMQMRYFLEIMTEIFNTNGKDSFIFNWEFFNLQPLRCFLVSLSYHFCFVPFTVWTPNHSFLHWKR